VGTPGNRSEVPVGRVAGACFEAPTSMHWTSQMPRDDTRVWRRILADSIGTFCLVFVSAGATIVGASTGGVLSLAGIALALTFVIVALFHTVGHANGTSRDSVLAGTFRSPRRASPVAVPSYVVAQCIASIVATVLLRVLVEPAARIGVIPASAMLPVTDAMALGVESSLVFMLTFVMLALAADGRVSQRFAPVAVGLTVGFCVLTSGLQPSPSFAPPQTGGLVIVGASSSHWIYWIAPIVAMVAGSRSHDALRGGAAPRYAPREMRGTNRHQSNVVDDVRHTHALGPRHRRHRAHTVIRPA
jgi:glycerol uptake facilitator-like aquaporin